MIYLIDYENVQDLKDVKELTSEDSVIVFHSGQTKRIQSDFIFDAIERVKFKAKRIVSGKKNALDFQLVSYLGYLIGKGETDIKIVSKDTGYDCLVDFWKGKANIMRGETFITVKDEPKEEKPLEKESSTAKKVAKKNTQKKTAKKEKAENENLLQVISNYFSGLHFKGEEMLAKRQNQLFELNRNLLRKLSKKQ